MNQNSRKIVLGLTFTENVTLKQWVDGGLFFREKIIYEKLITNGIADRVIWFTYGADDAVIRNKLVKEGKLNKKIIVVSPPWLFRQRFIRRLYSRMLPFICKSACKQLDIIKTNQTGGAETALAISRVYKIPLWYRTGYTMSFNFHRELLKDKTSEERRKLKKEYQKYSAIEKKLYKNADISTVTSFHDKAYVCKKYKLFSNKVLVVTNYIDIELFKKKTEIKDRQNRFLYVGRLNNEEKNVLNVVKGVTDTGIGIDLYGAGTYEDSLRRYINLHNLDAKIMGTVPNDELPDVYNSYKYFILGSCYEGMPKTLLEAMACGNICFGTDVEGISEVVKDKENGFLIPDTQAESIRKKAASVINQNADTEKISSNAIKYIRDSHSLNMAVGAEKEIIKMLINSDRNGRK